MNKTETLTLIEGSFSADEANEILMNIFSAKINFHEMKSFSSQVRFGKVDEFALRRIPQLKKSMEKITELVAESHLNKKKFIISSTINIQLVDDE